MKAKAMILDSKRLETMADIVNWCKPDRAFFEKKYNRLWLYFKDENVCLVDGWWLVATETGFRVQNTEELFGPNWKVRLS